MYKCFFITTLIFATTACNGPSSVPSSVLSYNEMKGVLWDMAQVDEFVNVYVRGTPKKIEENNLLAYQKVFALHKISNNEFAKSYTFYKSHPLQEKILMDSLLQFSTRQRQDRYMPISIPPKQLRLLKPAPMRMDNVLDDWHQFEIKANFIYE